MNVWKHWNSDLPRSALSAAHSAGRTLVRQPAFTLLALPTLVVSLAVLTGLASLLEHVVFRPLPFGNESEVVMIESFDETMGENRLLSWLNLFDVQDRTQTLRDVAGYSPGQEPVAVGQSPPEIVAVTQVGPRFLETLQTPPAIGRGFTGPEQLGVEPAVILSRAAAERWFVDAADAVGQIVTIRGAPVPVVGVMPRSFRFPTLAEAWVPLNRTRADFAGRPDWRALQQVAVVARARTGSDLTDIRADLTRIADALAAEYPETNDGVIMRPLPARQEIFGTFFPTLKAVVFGGALLIGLSWVNLFGLFTLRDRQRARDEAIRRALGAGRVQATSQTLWEAVLLLSCAGVIAFALVRPGLPLLLGSLPGILPGTVGDAAVRVVHLFAAVTLVATATLLPSILPNGLAARAGDAQLFPGRSRDLTAPARSRLRGAVVIAQASLSLTLVTATGLLAVTLSRQASIDHGIPTQELITFRYQAGGIVRGFANFDRFNRDVEREIRDIPGVEAVGTINSGLPFQFWNVDFTFVNRPADVHQAWLKPVTPGTLELLGSRVVRGRSFTDNDNVLRQRGVAVVNEAFVQRFLGGSEPLGTVLDKGQIWGANGAAVHEIIGVVADARLAGIDAPPAPTIYTPHAQVPMGGGLVVARTTRPFADVARDIRAAVYRTHPGIPVQDLMPMGDLVARQSAPTVYALWVAAILAAAGLLVAMTGLAATVAHGVQERRREFGLRIAVGASPGRIRRMVLREAWTLIGLSAPISAVLFLGSRGLVPSLPDVGRGPSAALGLAALALLLLAATWAAWRPAAKAASTPPATTLQT